MKLIITEKPSVARQFKDAIGGDFHKKGNYFESEEYYITWCVGHLVTLCYPEAYDPNLKKWTLGTLPFIPTEYKYRVIDEVKEQYQTVSKLLNQKDVTTIYYAGDSAREGEYIQRLIRNVGGHNPQAEEKRIWINSQTEEEILRGLREAKPLSEYDNLSAAGYLRAQEDFLFGINLSRALTIRYGEKYNIAAGNVNNQPIAVGRVMTFVLGMVVERDRLIRETKEIPFYYPKAKLANLEASWKVSPNSSYFEHPDLMEGSSNFKSQVCPEEMVALFNQKGNLTLISKKSSVEKKYAPMLFDLSELQGACSSAFKISPDETLAIAQKLYEKQMITYPRTDANVLSTAVLSELPTTIGGLKTISSVYQKAGTKILAENRIPAISKSKYVNDDKISDHYAIIPTGKNTSLATGLTETERNVYYLICKRLFSIFLDPVSYEKMELLFQVGEEQFPYSEKEMTDLGYLELFEETLNPKESFQALKQYEEGKTYDAVFGVGEGKTSPPKRYTSGNLILAMKGAGKLIEDEELRNQIKNEGIGTSATRAETVKKLIKNDWIGLDQKTQQIRAKKKGELIYNIIKQTVPSLLSAKMTASWEKGLAAVESGAISQDVYTQKINQYVANEVNGIKNGQASASIDAEMEKLKQFYSDISVPQSTDNLICPFCGGSIKKVKWGLVCEHYKNPCTFTLNDEIRGKKIPEAQMMKLIKNGITDKLKGFQKKDGGSYDAKLKINKETRRIEFDFS